MITIWLAFIMTVAAFDSHLSSGMARAHIKQRAWLVGSIQPGFYPICGARKVEQLKSHGRQKLGEVFPLLIADCPFGSHAWISFTGLIYFAELDLTWQIIQFNNDALTKFETRLVQPVFEVWRCSLLACREANWKPLHCEVVRVSQDRV